jgi:3-deoxy-manno-octulosonate cytidylyltransferase (CMP-KDO synthetase)
MKILGVIPARMAASRFPGKPLYPICGMPMVEHVYHRAAMFKQWDGLILATCDEEIMKFGASKNIPSIMTSDQHTRALDRVAEAASICGVPLADTDVVVCVQGDEPMMHPDMIDSVIKPIFDDSTVDGTVLAMEIVSKDLFINPDIVKIIHNIKGDVTYTSRSPVPYCKQFPPVAVVPRRIYGIFAFRWHFLQRFTRTPQSPLEIAESCDSNRIFDNGLRQRIAPYPYRPSFSVDNPADIKLVEDNMGIDSLWGKY